MRRRSTWGTVAVAIAVLLALALRGGTGNTSAPAPVAPATTTGTTPASATTGPAVASSEPGPAVSGGTSTASPAAQTMPATAPRTERAVVSRNVDGDTVHVTMPNGRDEKIRFIGVNTPESTIRHEPYGTESSNYTKNRLPVGTVVWLETDVELRDRYGRILAYLWLRPPRSDTASEVRAAMFNAELLLKGYAQLMTIPPDVKYADVFVPMQAEARRANRGLWGLPAQ